MFYIHSSIIRSLTIIALFIYKHILKKKMEKGKNQCVFFQGWLYQNVEASSCTAWLGGIIPINKIRIKRQINEK